MNNQKSKYPTAKQLKRMREKINEVDVIATETFDVHNKFGFRFNYNFRWFWGQSTQFKRFKKVGKMPYKEALNLFTINLN